MLQHPEYLDAGVTMSQFSFQTPKPLQEDYVRKRPDNYVKKRPAHLTASSAAKRLLEPGAEGMNSYTMYSFVLLTLFSSRLFPRVDME